MLEDLLRDHLVCGLRDDRAQRRLLAESKLTFAKAFEIAQASELAEGVRTLQLPVAGVNSIPESDDRKAAACECSEHRVERQPSSPWPLFPLWRQTFESDVQVQKLDLQFVWQEGACGARVSQPFVC